jgi:hypothetical protein
MRPLSVTPLRDFHVQNVAKLVKVEFKRAFGV